MKQFVLTMKADLRPEALELVLDRIQSIGGVYSITAVDDPRRRTLNVAKCIADIESLIRAENRGSR